MWNLEDLALDFGLKPKTNAEPLMDSVTVVGVISSDFCFSWNGGGGWEREEGTV